MTGPRVLHVVSELSCREAIGRTMVETAARVPGTHHVLAARIHDSHEAFASAHEVGGSLSWFALERAADVRAAVDAVQPDLVHLHGGVLTPLVAMSAAFGDLPTVQTLYAWPRLPALADARRATLHELRVSNVLRPRVAATTLVGPRAVLAALRRGRTRVVLSPDPSVVERLGGRGLPVLDLPSGAVADDRRAHWDAEAPTVVFAGRAETVRGIDTLVDAFPAVLARHPGARLRLLLLPTPELDVVVARIAAAGLGDAVDVVTTPIADLRAELAEAQVGVWPFKFDYTTSPPAMALAEAMAVGLPVVGTPVACIRSIARDGDNAELVPVGDASALGRAIADVLTDRARWIRLSRAGLRTIATGHNWEQAAAVTADAYTLALPATPGAAVGRPATTRRPAAEGALR